MATLSDNFEARNATSIPTRMVWSHLKKDQDQGYRSFMPLLIPLSGRHSRSGSDRTVRLSLPSNSLRQRSFRQMTPIAPLYQIIPLLYPLAPDSYRRSYERPYSGSRTSTHPITKTWTGRKAMVHNRGMLSSPLIIFLRSADGRYNRTLIFARRDTTKCFPSMKHLLVNHQGKAIRYSLSPSERDADRY